MSDYSHIIRVFLLLAAALIIVGVARQLLIPSSYGKYGPYRGDHLSEEMSSAPVIKDDEYCLECHEKEWDMLDGRHADVPCSNCHFLPILHAEGKKREVTEVAREYARHSSKLVFNTLYTVMSKGWDKEKIRALLEKLNDNDQKMKIRIFRGEPVIRQFGDIEEEREIREEDPDILRVLREGKDALIALKGNTIRYIYPIKAEVECLKCHTEAEEGSINGVIDIIFPIGLVVTKVKGKQKRIIDIAQDDARHASRLAFQGLYSVMSRGWDKEKIGELVNNLNRNEMNMTIRLYRGQPVIRQFGDIEGQQEKRENDPNIMRGLRLGNDIFVTSNPDQIRFLYPIKSKKDCLKCHRMTKTGEVLGIIDIKFPIARLKIKGLKKMADMPVDLSQGACTICHSYMPSRPAKFPQVKNFDYHYTDNWKTKLGLLDKKAECIICHKAHMPRIVKKGKVQ